MALVLDVSGNLTIGPPATTPTDQEGQCTYQFKGIEQHKCPTHEVSSREFNFNDTVGFLALIPQFVSPNLFRADTIYVKTKNAEAIEVRLTHLGVGLVIYNVRGTMFLELPAAELVTQVEIRGQAVIEYLFTGKLV